MPESAATPESKIIHAEPTKDFFVTMITRDILLRDCIFDLLDNAVDGARRTLSKSEGSRDVFDGFFAQIQFNKERFAIWDNCGGIRLSDAIDYAFHFGRRPDAPTDTAGGIGLYGIGMKRAIFKIGRIAEIISDADDACFRVSVDVQQWAKRPEWDFEYEDYPRSAQRGTKITISTLNPGIETEFADPVFTNELIRLIARDYAFFIEKGFVVKVGEVEVPSYRYQMKRNADLDPAVDQYMDDGVSVRIVAGLVDDLPDDIPDDLTPDKVERFGWFLVCNDRVVLAADKSERTIWGSDGYRVWHPQYNGFAGFVFFEAEDQAKLPWTTTKREVDPSSPLYKRALIRMKAITDTFAAYTNRRKVDLDEARLKERGAAQVDVYNIQVPQALRLPSFAESTPRTQYANIAYKKNVREVIEIREYLSRPAMSFKDVGIHTFEYFLKMELGK